MLTCKIGEETISTFGNKYDRYILKKWSNKNILKCPVCGDTYEYCHGEYVSPYFRHKEKQCTGYFTEPETEEHKKGKQLLYEWIKNLEGISNLQLEYWIPETKQRPDIYFEKDGKRYVIEFQCTPIASEFKERRELYRLAGIKDIWILGTDKYNITSSRYKEIEKDELTYLNVEDNSLIIDLKFVNQHKTVVPINKHWFSKSYCIRNGIFLTGKKNNYFLREDLFKFSLGQSGIMLSEDLVGYFKELEVRFIQEEKDRVNRIEMLRKNRINYLNKVSQLVEKVNQDMQKLDVGYIMNVLDKSNGKYNCYIRFLSSYIFFVKDHQIDLCEIIEKSRPFKNKRNKLQWGTYNTFENLGTVYFNDIEDGEVYDFLLESSLKISKPLEERKRRRQDKIKGLNDVLDMNIKIVDTDYIIPDKQNFMYLRDHNFYDVDFVTEDFARLLRKLKNKKKVIFLLRGSQEHELAIEHLQNRFGFKNVSKLQEAKLRGN